MHAGLAAAAERALDSAREVIRLVVGRGLPLVIVDSPPGAGKTWLVEEVVAVAAHAANMQVCVVTPRASQGFDLLRRIVDGFALPRVEALIKESRTLPPALAGRVARVDKARNLGFGPGVVVTTAHKLAA